MANSEEAAGDVVEHTKANEHTVGATNPATPVEGNLWSDTTASGEPRLKMYDGASWIPTNKQLGQWEHIETFSAGLATSPTTVFSSLRSDFTMFRLTGFIHGTNSGGDMSIVMRFNSDSGNNYESENGALHHSATWLESRVTAQASFRLGRYTNNAFVGQMPFSLLIVRAPITSDYSVTGTLGGDSVASGNYGGFQVFTGRWTNPTNVAISSIQFLLENADSFGICPMVLEGIVI